MSLSDIFSIPFLICLSICILLIGCSSIYFYQKISQQDHKISSMVSLISSLAEESQQNNNAHGGFISSPPQVIPSPAIVHPHVSSSFHSNHLIHVSDDENDDSESESESESSDSESETDAGSEESSDSDDEKSVNDTKTITIFSEDLAKEDTTTTLFELDEVDELDEENENENDDDDKSLFEMDELHFEVSKDDNHDVNDTTIVVNDTVVSEEVSEQVNDVAVEDIKSIHLDQPSVDEITDFSIFKTINISSLDESVNNGGETNNTSKIFETTDYKKMSITKLREIVSKQGVSDASKLKKSDIFKMLGVE